MEFKQSRKIPWRQGLRHARLPRLIPVFLCLISLATTPAVPARATETSPSRPAPHWLVIGDSYTSGEGTAGTTQLKSQWGQDCARATGMLNEKKQSDAKAWAITALETLVDTRRDVAFSRPDFVACTGAITDDVYRQIDEARSAETADLSGGDPDNAKSERTVNSLLDQWDLITLSMGGNNVGFAEIAEGCIDMVGGSVPTSDLPFSYLWDNPWFGGCDQSLDDLKKRADTVAGASSGKLERGTLPLWSETGQSLYLFLGSRVRPGGHVVVIGYPQGLEDLHRITGSTSLSRLKSSMLLQDTNCQGVSDRDIDTLRSFTTYLNSSIESAVSKADAYWSTRGVHFHFVDVATKVYETERGRHAQCTGEPWINGITTSLSDGDWRPGRSFHPTQKGHTESGRYIAQQIQSFDFSDAPTEDVRVGGFRAHGTECMFGASIVMCSVWNPGWAVSHPPSRYQGGTPIESAPMGQVTLARSGTTVSYEVGQLGAVPNLADGSSLQSGEVRCFVRSQGVTCLNGKHGFFVSEQELNTF